MERKRFAAIDIGTVTCRMLVADVDDTGITALDREYGIVNLGEGVDAGRKSDSQRNDCFDFHRISDVFV